MKKQIVLILALCCALALAACGSKQKAEPSVTVHVDAAASLSSSFEELIPLYAELRPDVTISLNTGSSGTLLTQIEEADGRGHDLFFSAGVKQVRTLDETDGLVESGTVVELLSNSLCLVTGNDSGTAVTGWADMAEAENMALCDGTVPVGRYSREALVRLGYLSAIEDNAAYTADEVSAALGGIEINECADVAAASQAVAEGSNEIGLIYATDWLDFADSLTVLAQDDGTLTGPIVYPVCQVRNADADEAERAAAEELLEFLQSDEAAEVFRNHGFVVER